MRIPTTAEFFTFFAATGQLSGLSRQPGADSEFSLQPSCERSHTVRPGDICNTLATQNDVPTYQIICQNDQIDGKCSNLIIGDEICLARLYISCWQIHVLEWDSSAKAIADQFHIPIRIFENNNYCYDSGFGVICPLFKGGTAVCVAQEFLGSKNCKKIFTGAS